METEAIIASIVLVLALRTTSNMRIDMESSEEEEGRVLSFGSSYLAFILRLFMFRASGICPSYSPTLLGTAKTNIPAAPPISMKVQYGIRRPNLKTGE